ncbi:MAG: hypothetical protein GX949_02300 [Peptococcaceae bacterium]|nr:hypothetical protein [Peptococcaceae bacterium]
MRRYYLQVYQHTLAASSDGEWVDISSLEIHPDIAAKLAELGIVEIRENRIRDTQVLRLQKLMRLRYNLGVNIKAAAIIMDLLERIEQLQDEINRLKK